MGDGASDTRRGWQQVGSMEGTAERPDAKIRPDAPKPQFQPLAGILRARIERGDWKPRYPIPSEARLVEEYGLSRPTVRRSISALVDAGYLCVVPQRGTYVAERTAAPRHRRTPSVCHGGTADGWGCLGSAPKAQFHERR
ncbi:GntR family transcriptional regulator [Streptomyces sp. 8N616]|uniref:GntR family transcriptional regulator n=1 Tax=Streptomyces sp. 8N616 TaxID=3457414 RepID=UPI003FCF1DFE